MDEKISILKYDLRHDEHKKRIKQKITEKKIRTFFEQVSLCFNRDFKTIINKADLFKLLIITFYIVIFITFYDSFPLKFRKFSLKLDIIKNLKKNENIEKQKKHNKNFIIVKNADGNPNTLAEIVINNKIDYVPKVSVIIPVFNTEEFLSKCLDTIVNQTLKEIEIICIDDGSTDNSLDILRKYAKQDKRIIVLKQENLNSGVARNAGLTIAKGKYLSFLDSDDFFELNMLEEMYKNILKIQSDIIICRTKSIDLDTGQFVEKIFNNSLRLDLIPKTNNFSVSEISKYIFQLCEGWAWDKLFRRDFIISNNIKFLNIRNFNDNQFTYTALCLAKSITTIKKIFVIKRHGHKKSLSANRDKDPFCFILSFNKIKKILKKRGLYNLVKDSFWKWFIKLSIIQLKLLNKKIKECLYDILRKKFKLWNYKYLYPLKSSRYKALQYMKNHKIFPTINIAYIVDRNHLNSCLISIISILKNSEYENINIILFFNNISSTDLLIINELKEIHSFTLQTINVSDLYFKYFPSREYISDETVFINLLSAKFYMFPNIEKLLYLECNTIIRKSLLSLWEIDMKDKLIAATQDLLFNKSERVEINLKHIIHINNNVILFNIQKWRKEKLYKKIEKILSDNNKNNISNPEILKVLRNDNIIIMNREFNFIINYSSKERYQNGLLDSYKTIEPIIINYPKTKNNISNLNNSFLNYYLNLYYSILTKIKDKKVIIPIVLSADDKYAPFMYVTIISILETGFKNTIYNFYLLVPSNFSKLFEKKILEINYKYNCNINFIYIQKMFEKAIMKIPHITLTTYYRLLIGDLLPREIDKCIYLDIDICVRKDLSELFKINMENNYVAGVVAAGYYFNEKKHCKRLNLPSMKKYINAGMLMINLKLIRNDNMTIKFIELSKRNYDSLDQDVINVACYGKILTLPPKYNTMVMRIEEDNPLLRELYKEEDIFEAKNAPYIIHYSNEKKPWNSIGIYMEKYWWDIAKKTPLINHSFSREKIYKNEIKKFWYKKKHKYLDIDRPRTFNEKIQWLKLYDSTPIKTRLSDKYLVREWIRETIGEEYLIPLLGVYDKFEDIDFEKLPNQFVIKCNHGSNYNIIVKNKSLLNLNDAKLKIEKWMNENYAFKIGLELQYRDIQHKIIIETFMDDGTGDLKDYKITCFDGKPHFIWVDNYRHSNHTRNFYDLNWNQLPYKINLNYSTFPYLKKPKCLGKMIELASILSKGFCFVRVDFYIINDKLYFGEMTFTSSSGTEDITPKNFERKLSLLIKIPKIAYNIDTGEYYEIKKKLTLYPYHIILIFLLFKLKYNKSLMKSKVL